MDLQKVLRFWKSLWETFQIWIPFTGINRYGIGAVFQLWTMCRNMYHVICRRVLWNGTFLDIYLTMFLGDRKFKTTFKISGSFFFWNSSKLENAKRNWENNFCFWDNCIRKNWYKLYLLRRKYLLSTVKRLTTSRGILYITQRDFFNQNYRHRDQ